MSNAKWTVPYSVERLLRLCPTWTFQSDVEDLPDCDDGEPLHARAYRRIAAALEEWRAQHRPNQDPWLDDTEHPFHFGDVAMIYDEYKRLSRLEEKVIDALGPPSVLHRWNRKTGKFEPE